MDRRTGFLRLALTLPILALFAIVVPAQGTSADGVGDPTPGEIEQDLAKRVMEWRAWQDGQSLKKTGGWQVKRQGSLTLAISKNIVGSRNITHMTNLSIALLKWCGARFKGITRVKARKPVIRICATGAEAEGFRHGVKGPYCWVSGEVVIVHHVGRSLLQSFYDLGEGLTLQYVDAQSPSLIGAFPEWLEYGLKSHARAAGITKRFGFLFRAPRGSYRHVLGLVNQGLAVPARDLVGTPFDEITQVRRNSRQDCRIQSELFVRYVTYGKGKKGRTKGFVRDYLRQLHADLALRELQLWKKVMKQEAVAEKAPTEQQRRRNYRGYLEDVRRFKSLPVEERRKIHDGAFQAAFGKWKPDNWKSVDKRFASWIKGGLR